MEPGLLSGYAFIQAGFEFSESASAKWILDVEIKKI
jgi:hypothetical protein